LQTWKDVQRRSRGSDPNNEKSLGAHVKHEKRH